MCEISIHIIKPCRYFKVILIFITTLFLSQSLLYSQNVDINVLIDDLKNKDRLDREFTAYKLGESKDNRAIEPLIEALKDENYKVRRNAATALSNFKDPSIIEALIATLNDPRSSVRRKVVIALGKSKDLSVLNHLYDAMQDTDWQVRKDAIIAISGFENANIVEPLLSVLEDSEPYVRKEAARVLVDKNNPKAHKEFDKAFKEYNYAIIAGAYEYYLRNWKSGSESILIRALLNYGDTSMGTGFLNSGNKKLEEAADNWAKENGYFKYQIQTIYKNK